MLEKKNATTTKQAETKWLLPEAPFFQTEFWANKFAQHRSDLCYYLGMPALQQDIPNLNDIVIHFRDFSVSRRRRRRLQTQLNNDTPPLFNRWEDDIRVNIPPAIYYDQILEAGNYDTIWLVAQPNTRGHPIIQHLLTKFGDKARMRHSETPDEDFQFISYASNIILSPSTFGWWAAFFAANGDGCTTIHFPIMPYPVPMPWCELASGFRGSSSNVIYHDWFSSNTTTNIDEAQWLCERYKQNPPSMESVAEFYPILDTETNNATNTGLFRKKRPWWLFW